MIRHRCIKTGRFIKATSLVDQMKAYQLAYDIIQARMQIEFRKKLAEISNNDRIR